MTWLQQNALGWRIVILILLVLTFIGPWGYDRILVPAQYECTPPNFRLDRDFCGIPLPGAWSIAVGLGVFFETFTGQGNAPISVLLMRLLYALFALLTPLPIFSSLFLMSSEEQTWSQARHLKVWGVSLVGGVGTFLLFAFLPGWFSFRLWGAWTYLLLAVAAMLFEIVVWRGNKRSGLDAVVDG